MTRHFLILLLAALLLATASCDTFTGASMHSVKVLRHITDSRNEKNMNNPNQYPTLEKIPDEPNSDLLDAYGGAFRVWLAPEMWTGTCRFTEEGNIIVRLHPATDSSPSGPQITYTEMLYCSHCAAAAAARFFPNAIDDYHSGQPFTRIPPPANAVITQVSQRLITYRWPSVNNTIVFGASYYISEKNGNPYYTEATVLMPDKDSLLAKLLVKNFIRKIDIDK